MLTLRDDADEGKPEDKLGEKTLIVKRMELSFYE